MVFGPRFIYQDQYKCLWTHFYSFCRLVWKKLPIYEISMNYLMPSSEGGFVKVAGINEEADWMRSSRPWTSVWSEAWFVIVPSTVLAPSRLIWFSELSWTLNTTLFTVIKSQKILYVLQASNKCIYIFGKYSIPTCFKVWRYCKHLWDKFLTPSLVLLSHDPLTTNDSASQQSLREGRSLVYNNKYINLMHHQVY